MAGDSGGITPIPTGMGGIPGPKGLLETIAAIEQLSFAERTGEPISEEAITRVMLMHYMEEGMKHSFLAGIGMLFTAPLSFGVLEKVVPVFGTWNPSFLDIVFALLLSALPLVVTAVFLSYIFAESYYGNGTSKAIKFLTMGVYTGGIISALIGWALLHFLYFFGIRSKAFHQIILSLGKIIGMVRAQSVLNFFYSLGSSMVMAAWYILGVTVLCIIIIGIGQKIGKIKTTQKIKIKDEWS